MFIDICRVCRLGGTLERPLFHPCMCTGSIRYVHQDWLVIVCKMTLFYMLHVVHSLMQWLRHSRKE